MMWKLKTIFTIIIELSPNQRRGISMTYVNLQTLESKTPSR